MADEGDSARVKVFDNVSGTIESDDLFLMRFSGLVDGPAIAQVLEFRAQWAGTKPHVFILVDTTQLEGYTFAARRELQVKRVETPSMTVVVFGSSYRMRVLGEMIVRAAKLLGRVPHQVEVHFVKSEQEARAMVEKKRRSS